MSRSCLSLEGKRKEFSLPHSDGILSWISKAVNHGCWNCSYINIFYILTKSANTKMPNNDQSIICLAEARTRCSKEGLIVQVSSCISHQHFGKSRDSPTSSQSFCSLFMSLFRIIPFFRQNFPVTVTAWGAFP